MTKLWVRVRLLPISTVLWVVFAAEVLLLVLSFGPLQIDAHGARYFGLASGYIGLGSMPPEGEIPQSEHEWSCGGLWYVSYDCASGTRFRCLVIPFYYPLPATAAFAFVAGIGTRRRVRRIRNGLCAACGYDLRASDGSCPECGTDPQSFATLGVTQHRPILAAVWTPVVKLSLAIAVLVVLAWNRRFFGL